MEKLNSVCVSGSKSLKAKATTDPTFPSAPLHQEEQQIPVADEAVWGLLWDAESGRDRQRRWHRGCQWDIIFAVHHFKHCYQNSYDRISSHFGDIAMVGQIGQKMLYKTMEVSIKVKNCITDHNNFFPIGLIFYFPLMSDKVFKKSNIFSRGLKYDTRLLPFAQCSDFMLKLDYNFVKIS